MNENSQIVATTIAGAIIGGIAGYLFFTNQGRELRRKIEPAVEDFARELQDFRSTVQKAAGAANEGWQLLHEALGEPAPPAYPSTRQTFPF